MRGLLLGVHSLMQYIVSSKSLGSLWSLMCPHKIEAWFLLLIQIDWSISMKKCLWHKVLTDRSLKRRGCFWGAVGKWGPKSLIIGPFCLQSKGWTWAEGFSKLSITLILGGRSSCHGSLLNSFSLLHVVPSFWFHKWILDSWWIEVILKVWSHNRFNYAWLNRGWPKRGSKVSRWLYSLFQRASDHVPTGLISSTLKLGLIVIECPKSAIWMKVSHSLFLVDQLCAVWFSY